MNAFKSPLALRAETPAAWADAALADPAALLSDHAHCEKKAALNALKAGLVARAGRGGDPDAALAVCGPLERFPGIGPTVAS